MRNALAVRAYSCPASRLRCCVRVLVWGFCQLDHALRGEDQRPLRDRDEDRNVVHDDLYPVSPSSPSLLFRSFCLSSTLEWVEDLVLLLCPMYQ